MDQLVRVIAKGAPVKAMAITGTDLVERARSIHDTWPVATAALGRLLMAASMMGDMLKEEHGSVTLRIRGGGPLGSLTAVSDSEGNVRGYVQNPAVDVPRKAHAKLDAGLSALELLKEVLSEFELEVLETSPVEYRCYCSRERVSRALISMGQQELTNLIEEQGGAELTCQFCDKVYDFSKEDLENLLKSALS